VSVTCLPPATTAEWIDVLFGVETLGGPTNTVLYVGPDTPMAGGGDSGKMLFVVMIVPYIHLNSLFQLICIRQMAPRSAAIAAFRSHLFNC